MEEAGSRRERYRRETHAEAKRLALQQLVEKGVGALSLNAIAHEMGMTGPALYRYVGSRDELLTDIVVDAYNDLGDALWLVVEETEGQPPTARLRAQVTAYRDWALANPHRYLLIFGTPVPGFDAPIERTLPAAHRTMSAALTLLAESEPAECVKLNDALDRELRDWAEQIGAPALSTYLLWQAIVGWSRLHGVLSLEIEGHFEQGLPDPALIYESEVDELARLLGDSDADDRGGSVH